MPYDISYAEIQKAFEEAQIGKELPTIMVISGLTANIMTGTKDYNEDKVYKAVRDGRTVTITEVIR